MDNTDRLPHHSASETIVAEIDPPNTEALVDLLDDERCYTVQAHLGDQFSNQSDPKCVPGGEGQPGQPGPGGTSLGIVALPRAFGPPSADDPGGRTIAEGQRCSC